MAKKAVIQAVVAGAITVFGIVFFMTHYVIVNYHDLCSLSLT